MSHSETLGAEKMSDVFKSGYTRGQIVKSVIAAFVLHAVLLGGYIMLGSSHKPVAKKEDAKTAFKTDASATASTTPAAGAAKTAPNGDAPKGDSHKADVAKPGEVPSAPDSDIDAILKSK